MLNQNKQEDAGMKKLILTFLSVFCLSGFASSPLKVLEKPFELKSYEACMSHMKSCPRSGPYLSNSCVDNQLKQNAKCAQFGKLAAALKQGPQFISVAKHNNLYLISIHFPADAKKQYAVLTHDGRLVQMMPSKNELTKLFPVLEGKEAVLIPVAQSIHFKKLKDHQMRVVVKMNVHKHCLACKKAGSVLGEYEFSSQGAFLKYRYRLDK